MSNRLDPRLIQAAAGDLRGARGLPFTARQLWYASCARMETPELTEGTAQLVAGILMVVVGVVAGILASAFVAALVPIGMVVTGMGVQSRRAERNRPTTRALVVSYDRFLREGLDALRGESGVDGLIDTDGDTPVVPVPEATQELPVVVCDRPETASLLAALAASGALQIRAVDESMLGASLSVGRLYALHDADPRGCALPLRLAAAGAAQVVDLGLRPAQISGRHIQVIEGAPAIVGAELGALLEAEELVWLADGRRVELAVLTPAELADGVRGAIDATPVSPPGVAPAAVALAGVSLILVPEVAAA